MSNMAEIECTAKKWGNSLGIVIPNDIVQKEHITENENITVIIKKKHLAKEFFGILPDWKGTGQKIKNDMRKGW